MLLRSAAISFIYSGNIRSPENTCTCCANCPGKDAKKEETISTSIIVSSSPQKGCCGTCRERLKTQTENKPCTCCAACPGKNMDNNSSTDEVIVHISPRNGCCGTCEGKFYSKTVEITTENLLPEWKLNQNQRAMPALATTTRKDFSVIPSGQPLPERKPNLQQRGTSTNTKEISESLPKWSPNQNQRVTAAKETRLSSICDHVNDELNPIFRNSRPIYSKQSQYSFIPNTSLQAQDDSLLLHNSILGTVGTDSSYLQDSLNVEHFTVDPSHEAVSFKRITDSITDTSAVKNLSSSDNLPYNKSPPHLVLDRPNYIEENLDKTLPTQKPLSHLPSTRAKQPKFLRGSDRAFSAQVLPPLPESTRLNEPDNISDHSNKTSSTPKSLRTNHQNYVRNIIGKSYPMQKPPPQPESTRFSLPDYTKDQSGKTSPIQKPLSYPGSVRLNKPDYALHLESTRLNQSNYIKEDSEKKTFSMQKPLPYPESTRLKQPTRTIDCCVCIDKQNYSPNEIDCEFTRVRNAPQNQNAQMIKCNCTSCNVDQVNYPASYDFKNK